jgi:hypothetical protein
MKKRLIIAAAYLAPVLMLQLTSCSGDSEKDNELTVKQDTTANDENLEDKIFYQIPTPNELFAVMKEIGGKGNPSLLIKISDVAKFTEPRQKAMVFGALAADMAYAASYDLENTLEYLSTIQSMSKDLEISGAFDESIFKAANENMEKSNSDSLMKLSNDVYFKAYAYLEDNERGAMLGQIVTGGWIESLYMMVNIAGPYKDKDPIIQRIIEQKLNYENLWGFLMKYEDDDAVKKTIAELEELGMIFDSFETKASDVEVNTKEGVDVISGGTEIVPNKLGYNDLVNKIKEMRNRIISVNS